MKSEADKVLDLANILAEKVIILAEGLAFYYGDK